jgi:hypothetical protein
MARTRTGRRSQELPFSGAGESGLPACLGFASAALRHLSRQEHGKGGNHQQTLLLSFPTAGRSITAAREWQEERGMAFP